MKLILKSLISNEASITGSRKHKWWVALLILLFSLIISVLPMFVQTISTQGDSIFASSSYGLDVALVDFVDQCDQSGIELKIEDHKFVANDQWSKGTPVEFIPANGDGKVDTQFYWVSDDISSISGLYKDAQNTVVIFMKEDVLLKLVNPNTGTVVVDAQYYQKAYKDFDNCDLLAFLRGSDNVNEINFDRIWSNGKEFFKKAYNYNRVVNGFGQAGIIAGVNVVVAFLMGLMVFILTRGKTNVFRQFTFWDGQKIAYWSSISPAILGMIFGFIIPNFASMSFVLFYGIRVMWLTMKQLRPDGSGYAIPKDLVKTVDVKSVK